MNDYATLDLETSKVSVNMDTIITISPVALTKLKELRGEEPDADKLGLRIAITSPPGQAFVYDLTFEEFLKAAFNEEVRTIDGLKIIIPNKDTSLLRGAKLDYDEQKGLTLNNSHRPKTEAVEGLVHDDELSTMIDAIVIAEVNPMLKAHGGFVTYRGHDTKGTAYVTMGGGCHGCSLSTQTMLEGVEKIIAEQIKDISSIRDLTDHTTGENPYYR